MKSPESKELKDLPGYWIHPDGRLWSEKSQKFLKASRGGYKGNYQKYQFCLKNKKHKIKYVHRLLMEYFGPPMPEGCNEVNHIDGNTKNNCLSNLEWTSSSENTRHGIRTGLFSRVLLTEEQVKEIKKIFKCTPDYRGKVPDIAKKYGVKNEVIMQIKHNRNWKHISID